VLLLRGPQTLGELRARTDRMATFAGLEEIEEVLRLLSVREQPLARQLERQPGQKEARYAELLSGEVPLAMPRREPTGPGLAERVAALEETVAALEETVAALRASAEEFRALLE
jgi:uncharacterized protein YceH (UPF0502 family)